MSDLAWTKAKRLLDLKGAERWPDSLSIERLAVLQAGKETKEQRDDAQAIHATLLAACKAGTLPCEAEEHTIRPRYTVDHQGPAFARRNLYGERVYTDPPPPPPQPQRKTTIYKLRPEVFAGWLAQNKLPPAELVAAWLDAKGTTPVVQPVVTAEESGQVAAQSTARILKKRDLIAELASDWPSIERDVSEASRNGLGAKAHSATPKGWDVEKARSWAEANCKLRRSPAAPTWPSARIHKIKG
jgi:hypothetical protein